MVKFGMRRVAGLLLVISMMAVSLTGCSASGSDLEQIKAEYSEITAGDYDLELKFTNNGQSSYIKFDGIGTSSVQPFSEYTEIMYKRGGEEYQKLTDIYMFQSDIYVDTSSLFSKIATLEGMEEYSYMLEGLDKQYMLINDTTMKKAFGMYIDNDPNLAIKNKARIITERETAYGINDVASLRAPSLNKNEEEIAELSSMSSFLPSDYKSTMVSVASELYNVALNNGVNADLGKKFGVYEMKLDSENTGVLLAGLSAEAENNALVEQLMSEGSQSEFSDYLVNKYSDVLNKALKNYIDSVASTLDENAQTIVRFSNTGFNGKHKSGIYVQITSDGVNGFEMLYHNKEKVKAVEVEMLSTVPSDCYTVADVFKAMAVSYLEK